MAKGVSGLSSMLLNPVAFVYGSGAATVRRSRVLCEPRGRRIRTGSGDRRGRPAQRAAQVRSLALPDGSRPAARVERVCCVARTCSRLACGTAAYLLYLMISNNNKFIVRAGKLRRDTVDKGASPRHGGVVVVATAVPASIREFLSAASLAFARPMGPRGLATARLCLVALRVMVEDTGCNIGAVLSVPGACARSSLRVPSPARIATSRSAARHVAPHVGSAVLQGACGTQLARLLGCARVSQPPELPDLVHRAEPVRWWARARVLAAGCPPFGWLAR